MKAAIARMFMKMDGIQNPKMRDRMREMYENDVSDLITGTWNHIIKPVLRIAKWTAVILVAVNLLMLIFGESRLIADWSAMDRLRYEWQQLRRLIDWHIL